MRANRGISEQEYREDVRLLRLQFVGFHPVTFLRFVFWLLVVVIVLACCLTGYVVSLAPQFN